MADAERTATLRLGSAEAFGELTLETGAITLLLGANGAGKTSWLETAAGLRGPDGLDIAYGESPLWIARGRRRKLNAEALRSYAYGSQAPEEQLLFATVAEELADVLAPYRLDEAERESSIDRALAAVGWSREWLGRNPYRLSGGERRRLGLACLFAAPASWLLLDEPTAGLDAAGQRLLAQRLRQARDAGQGVLLVSHDSEWALPLADRVLLLAPDGALRACGREELLRHPQWWAEAGMEQPYWLRVVGPLLRAEPELAADAVWQPERLVLALGGGQEGGCDRGSDEADASGGTAGVGAGSVGEIGACARMGRTDSESGNDRVAGIDSDERAVGTDSEGRNDRVAGNDSNESADGTDSESGTERTSGAVGAWRVDSAGVAGGTEGAGRTDGTGRPGESGAAGVSGTRRGMFRPRRDRTGGSGETKVSALVRLDPRAVWLSYVLLSLVIFGMRSWTGVGLSAVVTVAAAVAGRFPLRRWRGVLAAFAVFAITVSLVSGIGAGWTLNADALLTTLQTMARTLLVMLLGFGLTLTITPLRLRRSLEQLLSFRGRVGGLAQRFILTVALILRFIPVLLGEWARFDRYAIARGKETSRTPRALIRRLVRTALPFMLALFRTGDQVADALESRGVGSGRQPTLLRTQRWSSRDSALVAVALAIALALRQLG